MLENINAGFPQTQRVKSSVLIYIEETKCTFIIPGGLILIQWTSKGSVILKQIL